jgi:hypothetical protein
MPASGEAPVRRFYLVPTRRLDIDMGAFYNIMVGYFFGFALGVGCALAVFYSIYSGGYRKAVQDSLQPQKSKRYLEEMAAAMRRAEKRAKEPA